MRVQHVVLFPVLCVTIAMTACSGGGAGTPCVSDAEVPTHPDGWVLDAPCDGDRPGLVDGGQVTGASSLVIDGHGTIYYTQPFAVGRWRDGMPEEDRWVQFPNGTMLSAITLDPLHHRLVVAAPSDHALYAIDLTASTPTPSVLLANAGLPNGLTLSPCGDLFYTDLSLGNVFWVDASGHATQVNNMGAIAEPAGLAFGPDEALYVTSVGEGSVKRLVLASNLEQSRTTVLSSTSMTSNVDAGIGAPHAIAFDLLGRIYVTDDLRRALLRFNADGTHGTSVMGSLPQASGLDFGAGTLNCGDLYIANSGPLQRYTGGNAPGATVLWHQ